MTERISGTVRVVSVVEERKGQGLSEQKAYVTKFYFSKPETIELSNARMNTGRVIEKGKSWMK
jgi:hypothetical protein